MKSIRVLILTTGFVLALSGCQTHAPAAMPQGITLLETVERADDNGIVIPYRKFQLDNGLTVILHEDMSDPLVHVDITYHVGSGREPVGKSGFGSRRHIKWHDQH